MTVGGSLRGLRWLTVLLPVAFVGVVEVLSDTVLDETLPFPWDTLTVMATMLVVTVFFSTLGFRRIDALRADLVRRNRELEEREARATALHRMSIALATRADLDRLLDGVVEQAWRLLDGDLSVLLVGTPDGRMAVRAASGATASMRPEPVPDADPILRVVRPEGAVARVGAPLRRGDQTVGLLAVCASSPRSFDADAVETLGSLANQAAVALENARLEARLRELAVVEERERIARELHDGIAQVLGYVNTKSQAADELLAAGRVAEARAQLAQLGSAARASYVDVREAILGLRAPLAPDDTLADALQDHAARFAEASKLAVRVVATPAARTARLSPEASSHAFRLVQEALTNVRKHAGARRVEIRLDADDATLTVEVLDDGRGFEPRAPTVMGELATAGASGGRADGAAQPRPDPADRPRYGLRIMRERAAAIDAAVDWRSAPGAGTTVRLVIPLAGAPRPDPVIGSPAP